MSSLHPLLFKLLRLLTLFTVTLYGLTHTASAQTGLIQFEGVLDGYIDESGEPVSTQQFVNNAYRATLEFDISGLEPDYINDDLFRGNQTTYLGVPMQLAIEVLDASNQVITTVTQHHETGNSNVLQGSEQAYTHAGIRVQGLLQSTLSETTFNFNWEGFTADYFNEYFPFVHLLDQTGSFTNDSGVFEFETNDVGVFLSGTIDEITTFYLHTCDEFSAAGLDAPCDPLALQDYIGQQQALTDAAEAENRNLTKQLQLADTRYAALERTMQQLRANIATRNAQIAQLQQQKAALTATNADLQQQVSALQASNADQLLTITQLQQSNQSLQSQLDAAMAQRRALERQIDNLQIAKARLESDVADANRSLAVATAQLAALQDTVATADTATTELQSHLRDVFGDDEFLIGDEGNATAALVEAILDMNHGQQQALYRNLGGEQSKGNGNGNGKGK